MRFFARVLLIVLGSALTIAAPAFADDQLSQIAGRIQVLNTAVRDGLIAKDVARRELALQLAQLDGALSGRFPKPSNWVFPLKGYDPSRIGRSSYHAKGYDFFQGNRHGGHPSEDLFIRERKRDALDPKTGQPVTVLSLTDGIVVASDDSWKPGSRLRGGNYLWVYDPHRRGLVYYAHNDRLLVSVGDVVHAGTAIATVGRTGWNAYKKRSPSHLHLTYLLVHDGYPKPVNIYTALKQSRPM